MGIIMDFPSYWQGQRNFKKSKQQQKKSLSQVNQKIFWIKSFVKLQRPTHFRECWARTVHVKTKHLMLNRVLCFLNKYFRYLNARLI